LGLPLSFGLVKLMSGIMEGLDVSVGLTGVLAGALSCIAASVIFGLYPAYLGAPRDPGGCPEGGTNTVVSHLLKSAWINIRRRPNAVYSDDPSGGSCGGMHGFGGKLQNECFGSSWPV